jgi:hypothetical protein
VRRWQGVRRRGAREKTSSTTRRLSRHALSEACPSAARVCPQHGRDSCSRFDSDGHYAEMPQHLHGMPTPNGPHLWARIAHVSPYAAP